MKKCSSCKSKKWIQKAINPAHKGELREELHVKKGKNIPASKLKAAEKKGGKIGKQAHLAETLKKLHKKSDKKVTNPKKEIGITLLEARKVEKKKK